MENELSTWLPEELERRVWPTLDETSRAGVSQTSVSGTVSGKRKTGEKFLMKVSKALNEPLVNLYRLAGLLPLAQADPLITELYELIGSLPSSRRKQAVDYLRFLYQKREDEE